MDRNDIIRICNVMVDTSLTRADAYSLLLNYIKDIGKESSKTITLIEFILRNPVLLSHSLNVALSYYKKKFNIVELYSKEDSFGNKKLLLIQ